MDKNILPDRVMATVCTLVFVSLSAFYYVNFTPTNMTLTISQSVAKVGNTTDVNKESMQSFLLPNPNVSQECTRSFERSHMTKVLLITYYRGGSSFLGQMFAQKRDAFYWFEPLDDVKLTMSNSMVNMANEIKMVGTNYQLLDNGTLGQLPKEHITPRTQTLVKILTCNATSLSQVILSGKFFKTGQGMPRFRSYMKCLRQMHEYKYKTCAKILEETCLNSTIVAAKVIRYPMYEVHQLIEVIPELKVIYYIRDPRGIMASRANIHGWSGATLAQNARYLCLEITENMKTFRELQRRNSGNYLLLKYEDLALKTEETARRIYEFIDHDYPKELSSWIDQNTNAKRMDWTYGTRRNSKQTVFNWRKRMKTRDKKIVTDQCFSVLKILGYEI